MLYAGDQQTWDPRLVPSRTLQQVPATREAATRKACPPQAQRSPSLPLLERNPGSKGHPALPKGVKWLNKYIKIPLNKCIFKKTWEIESKRCHISPITMAILRLSQFSSVTQPCLTLCDPMSTSHKCWRGPGEHCLLQLFQRCDTGHNH